MEQILEILNGLLPYVHMLAFRSYFSTEKNIIKLNWRLWKV